MCHSSSLPTNHLYVLWYLCCWLATLESSNVEIAFQCENHSVPGKPRYQSHPTQVLYKWLFISIHFEQLLQTCLAAIVEWDVLQTSVYSMWNIILVQEKICKKVVAKGAISKLRLKLLVLIDFWKRLQHCVFKCARANCLLFLFFGLACQNKHTVACERDIQKCSCTIMQYSKYFECTAF